MSRGRIGSASGGAAEEQQEQQEQPQEEDEDMTSARALWTALVDSTTGPLAVLVSGCNVVLSGHSRARRFCDPVLTHNTGACHLLQGSSHLCNTCF
jgi:hypothetical protein